MKLNEEINKNLKQTDFQNRLYGLFRKLKNEYKITCIHDFGDCVYENEILESFVNKFPELNEFVFLANFDIMNNDFTDHIIVRFGFTYFVQYHLIETAMEFGFEPTIINKNKLLLKLKIK